MVGFSSFSLNTVSDDRAEVSLLVVLVVVVLCVLLLFFLSQFSISISESEHNRLQFAKKQKCKLLLGKKKEQNTTIASTCSFYFQSTQDNAICPGIEHHGGMGGQRTHQT